MKKILLTLFILLSLLAFSACKAQEEESLREVSVIMPTGTPALGLATYANTASKDGSAKVEVVGGADLLKTAFINKTHDIIVAPVNLGAMMYNTYESYVLYKAFVWGNLYLVSKNTLTGINDLNGKTVVVFGQNSTPDIVFRAILASYSDVSLNIEYTDDVSSANTMLVSGKAEYIISAEPSLTKIKGKLAGASVIDLQEEWKKLSGSSSYPQAGIFVNKEVLNDKSVVKALEKMTESVKDANKNPSKCAENAVELHESFATLTKEVLEASIPNCHFDILESDKDAVNFYLQKMIDLGFSKQVGGKLPSEGFFN